MMEHELDPMESTKPPREHRRFSWRSLILTGLISLFLGMTLTVGAFWLRLGSNGLSVIQAMTVIRGHFVGEYEWTKVTDSVLDRMVESLGDRWSYFLSREDYDHVMATRNNSYTGIGVTISRTQLDAIHIIAVAEGSPADDAGIREGDAVTAVDGEPINAENWDAAVEKIRGEPGTGVELTIQDLQGETHTVLVMRQEIHSNPVEYEMLEGDVGLLQLRNFYSGSSEAFTAGVQALQAAGAKCILFDVRDNPGGYVKEMTTILDYLLPEGVIFISRDLDGSEQKYTSDASAVDLPFAVLVNGESYSAAEFFAAELQESAGAKIVGEPTSGKGYAQQLFPLRNGSAVGISTSRYFTGAGNSLIGVGITPDPLVNLNMDDYVLLLQGNLAPQDDPQIQAAISALNQRG